MKRVFRSRRRGTDHAKVTTAAARRGLALRALTLDLTIVPVMALAVCFSASAGMAQSVYTVANYPVGAVAVDAVKAEKIALRRGQARALRSLLKRLIPVTDLFALPQPTPDQIAGVVADYTVRDVETSGTEYLANIDFRFDPQAVRALARDAQLRIVDQQAEPTLLLALYAPSDVNGSARGTIAGDDAGADAGAAGSAWTVETTSVLPPSPFKGQNPATVQRTWARAWEQLDLANALTPLRLRAARSGLSAQMLDAVRAGDPRAAQALARAYKTTSLVVATIAPSPRAGFMTFTLGGLDRRGPISLERHLPMLDGDLALSLEAAAVIGLGVLEGRWKALKAPPKIAAVSAAPIEPVVFSVQFSSLREWRNVSDYVRGLPGAQNVEVVRARSRERELQLMLPGGEATLRDALSRYGYTLAREGPTLIARRS